MRVFESRKRWSKPLTAAALVLAGGVLFQLAVWAGPALTPLSSYSGGWQGIAKKYEPDLAGIESSLQGRFSRDQLRFPLPPESAVSAIGFWPNPVGGAAGSRYLCVFVKVRVPPPSTGMPFRDDQNGRVLMIWDFYAKFTMGLLSAELQKMNEPEIAGGAIIAIYNKLPLDDPSFHQTAEAFALFMPKPAVIQYAQHRMTNQTLFSQSEMFGILEGQQISILSHIFRP